MHTLGAILIASSIAAGSITATEFTFNGSGKIDAKGKYRETQTVDGQSLTMTLSALSDFENSTNPPSVSFKKVKFKGKPNGVIWGVHGGAGGKANYTVDTNYRAGEIANREILMISFNQNVILNSYSIGNMLTPEKAVFQLGRAKHEVDTISADFQKIKALQSPRKLRFSSTVDKTKNTSNVSLKSLTVTLSGQTKKTKKPPKAAKAPKESTLVIKDEPVVKKPTTVFIKNPEMETWLSASGKKVEAMLLKVENNASFTFMTSDGKELTIDASKLTSVSAEKARKLAEENR